MRKERKRNAGRTQFGIVTSLPAAPKRAKVAMKTVQSEGGRQQGRKGGKGKKEVAEKDDGWTGRDDNEGWRGEGRYKRTSRWVEGRRTHP
jgi:hypothetical protein